MRLLGWLDFAAMALLAGAALLLVTVALGDGWDRGMGSVQLPDSLSTGAIAMLAASVFALVAVLIRKQLAR